MLRRLELDRGMHESLIEHCRAARHRLLLHAASIPQSVDLLAELGADRFKIPSGEITDLPYLRHVGGYGKPVILSSGMATLGEIEAAIDVLEASGTPRERITVLHCTTEYPAPMADVNLRAMLTIRDALGVAVGYSDHTVGIEVAIAAVALGASVIEKHFTLDRTLPGPDHKASLEPARAQSHGRSRSATSNRPWATGSSGRAQARRRTSRSPANRWWPRAPIRAGETFSAANLAAKRPGTGVSPMRWDEVIGRKARRDFAADELIDL